MPDNQLLKTGGTGGFADGDDNRLRDDGWSAGREPDGKSRKGYSGNPAGRPKGSFRAGTRAAARLLDAQAEALAQKAIEMALDGDPVAVRFCLGRILGVRRGQPVELGRRAGRPRRRDRRNHRRGRRWQHHPRRGAFAVADARRLPAILPAAMPTPPIRRIAERPLSVSSTGSPTDKPTNNHERWRASAEASNSP